MNHKLEAILMLVSIVLVVVAGLDENSVSMYFWMGVIWVLSATVSIKQHIDTKFEELEDGQ